MKTAKIAAAALVCAAFAAAPARAADLWIHVHVDEQGPEAAKVRVNLPVGLIETAMTLVEDENVRNGRIVLNETEFSLADLRALWNQLKATPDATFVEVEQADETVKVSKQGGNLLVRVRAQSETGSNVDVKVPENVVEALLSGEGEELNVAAALQALAAHGEGELVTVDEHDTKVRVWVDSSIEG